MVSHFNPSLIFVGKARCIPEWRRKKFYSKVPRICLTKKTMFAFSSKDLRQVKNFASSVLYKMEQIYYLFSKLDHFIVIKFFSPYYEMS